MPSFFSRSLVYWLVCLSVFITACDVWNNPYPNESSESVKNGGQLYGAFLSRPKHLDPAQSYSEDEADVIGQIYEPPLQYHYLQRPYRLIPAAASVMPETRFLNAQYQPLSSDVSPEKIAYTEYIFTLRDDLRYQAHPAFIEANRQSSPLLINGAKNLSAWAEQGSRKVTAEDYAYQAKRLAHPLVNSPVFAHLAEYIVGLRDLQVGLQKELKNRSSAPAGNSAWLDLRKFDLKGFKVQDPQHFSIIVKGNYPQILYWMAMSFFAPIPWEADEFYSMPGMAQKNIGFDWYPVGSGPYFLEENNPNSRMVLTKNPYYHPELYPAEGEISDQQNGLLKSTGHKIPFIHQMIMVREKEQIPYWNKFLQGYYDTSGISSDNFDQAVRLGAEGETTLSSDMRMRGITLSTALSPSTFYIAFNWLDPVVGGEGGERARKLRTALSLAFDIDEMITVFMNGRGIPAQGPIPPGIFGFRQGEEGINPIVYDWNQERGRAERYPLEKAKELLAEAGYPNGRDAKTGAPLVLYLDAVESGPASRSRFDWYRKQFAKLNIQLEIRVSDANRFQDKLKKGNTQIFTLGWNADYPDPENFLFLLYGPNSTIKGEGENKSNYSNPEYDRLFETMSTMPNTPTRQDIIDRMLSIARHDSPWLWGVHPKAYTLSHEWLDNEKPNAMARNTLKYKRLNTDMRTERRQAWNQPVIWTLILLLPLLVGLGYVVWNIWQTREQASAYGEGEAF